MPRILVSDIDGVLTDGTVLLDAAGNEQKRISFRDLDALFQMHRTGWVIGFVTGEQNAWVEMIRKRLPYKYFFDGCKDKRGAVQRILAEEQATRTDLYYIGDGNSDIPAMAEAGVAACPADAAPLTIDAANLVLKSNGGHGAIEEFVHWIRSSSSTTRSESK
jgi:YrbI family 3-deoxy-D-manno-octulosonate 8-phosphate phosphatase